MALSKLMEGIYADVSGTNGGNHGAIVLENEIVMIDSGMIHHKSLETKNNLEEKVGLSIENLILTHIVTTYLELRLLNSLILSLLFLCRKDVIRILKLNGNVNHS